MRRTTSPGLLAITLLLAATVACGDDQASPAAGADATSATAADPTITPPASIASDSESSVAAPASDAPTADVPTAIVSLSPTATEMIYAIGAGDQVVAVDDFSNYPPETSDKMRGINAFEPNVEAIAALEPDLVLTDGTNPAFLAQLDALGIAHWEGPAAVTFDDIYAQLEQLGAATGHIGEAAELVAQMQGDVDAVIDALPQLAEPLTYYHELDPTYYSVTSDTFIGLVYAEAGLVNIADEVGDGNPYPQLNAEFIVSADPDLIFLACTKYCGETPESVAVRDGWGELTAVTTGGVIPMDDDIASRWGPRIVDYLRAVGDAVTAVAPAAAG